MEHAWAKDKMTGRSEDEQDGYEYQDNKSEWHLYFPSRQAPAFF
jgi:hypothetical protein